ncbi:MAG: hypothetical protein WBL80_03370 [Erysipelotrichaceae bacterium]
MSSKEPPRTELENLQEIFKTVDPAKQRLVGKLIEYAAFTSDEIDKLIVMIRRDGGTVKIHPTNPGLQKATEAGKQYLKLIGSYSLTIKALNSVLTKNAIEEEDEFERYMNPPDETE